MIRCLLGRHSSGAHFFFDDRVIFSFAVQLSVRSETVKSGIADMSEGRNVAFEVERNDGCGHHRKLRVLLGHLVNGGVGTLNRELHQVFHVGAVNLVAKRFVEHLDRCLRRNFACFRAAYAVVWVNPVKGSPEYQPLAAGMRAALPSIDRFVAGHNLASLEALAGLLARIERRHGR